MEGERERRNIRERVGRCKGNRVDVILEKA